MHRVLMASLMGASLMLCTAAAAPESEEETIARLEKRQKSLKHEIQGLKTRLKKSKKAVGKKLAPLVRNDTGFALQAIDADSIEFKWTSKHAGKKLSGTVTAGADGAATLSARSK